MSEKIGIYLHGCIGDTIHATTAFWYILEKHNFPEIHFLSSCTGRPDIVESLVRDVPGFEKFEFKKLGCPRFRAQHNVIKKWNVNLIYDLCPLGPGIWDATIYKRISKVIPRIPQPFDPWFKSNRHVEKYLSTHQKNAVIHRYTGWHNVFKYRNLPYKEWKKVTELLKDWGYNVILIGYDDPYEVNNAIDINLIKKTNVLESLALVRMADIFLGVISGMFHYSRFYHGTIAFASAQLKKEMDTLWFTHGLEPTKKFVKYFSTTETVKKDELDKAIQALIINDRKIKYVRESYLLDKFGLVPVLEL